MTVSLYRRLRFRHSVQRQAISTEEQRLLEVCTGREIAVDDSEARAYLLHFKSLADEKWTSEIDSLFYAEYELPGESLDKIIQLSAEVASVIRKHGGISICRLVQKLQIKGILCQEDDLSGDPFARSLIFNLIGWLSLLYIPARRIRSNDLKIVIQSDKSAIRSNVATEMAARPLDELLRSFGDLLPRSIARLPSKSQSLAEESIPATKFQVSHLNVATLRDIANMQIVWVDTISAHLEFDPTIPSLSLFKCPSFCKIHKSPDSILAM